MRGFPRPHAPVPLGEKHVHFGKQHRHVHSPASSQIKLVLLLFALKHPSASRMLSSYLGSSFFRVRAVVNTACSPCQSLHHATDLSHAAEIFLVILTFSHICLYHVHPFLVDQAACCMVSRMDLAVPAKSVILALGFLTW